MFCAGSRGRARIGTPSHAAWWPTRKLRKPCLGWVPQTRPLSRAASKTLPVSRLCSMTRCEARPGSLANGLRSPIFPSGRSCRRPNAWSFPSGIFPKSFAGTQGSRRCLPGGTHLPPKTRPWRLGSRKEAGSPVSLPHRPDRDRLTGPRLLQLELFLCRQIIRHPDVACRRLLHAQRSADLGEDLVETLVGERAQPVLPHDVGEYRVVGGEFEALQFKRLVDQRIVFLQ